MMKTGDLVEHINKESDSEYSHDKKYTIVNYNNVRMKDKTSGKWFDAVIYSEDGITLFVREKEDFENEFKVSDNK